MFPDYHTVDYARHSADNSVHLLDLEVGKTLCGRSGVFEPLPASDAMENGMCDECNNADRPVYSDDGERINRSVDTDTERGGAQN